MLKRARRPVRANGRLSEDAAYAAKVTAWACVDHMAALATAVPCDHTDVWLAGKQRRLHGDYEDDLVIAAAMRSGADLLVTYDEELRDHATVAAATPTMTWLEALAGGGRGEGPRVIGLPPPHGALIAAVVSMSVWT